MTRCFRCGSPLPADAQFCGRCGVRASDPHADTMVIAADESDELLQRVRLVFAGEYDVEREVGQGGMAVVFQATDVELHRAVALKVLRPELGLTPRATERFKREARMVAALSHPNIIPVYHVGQLGGIFHIVMKLVEGRSLDAIVAEQGPLPVPVVLSVLRAATRALAYAHERDIVHRDVKSANILVDTDGRVMISDFGIALRASDATLTAVGTVIGTPAFMSPEQCAGQRAGPPSDQYSLGIVAFQMLTGSVPFEAETLAGLMQHHFFTPVPEVGQIRDDIPVPLLQVLRRALAKEPGQRFVATRDMLAALEVIPFPEADRRESEAMLRELARGTSLPKLRTRSLPPLPDARTLPLVPQAPLRFAPRLSPRAAAVAGLIVAGIGGVWWLSFGRAATSATIPVTLPFVEPATVAGGPAPAAPPAIASPGGGRLRLLTSPPTADILIDGRRVGVGGVFDLRVPAGARRVQVRARGYQPFDTTVVVDTGVTVSLGRIALREGGR